MKSQQRDREDLSDRATCVATAGDDAAAEARNAVIDPALVRQHLSRAVELLAEQRADGLFIFRDTNILAFCGVPLAPSDRLACGLMNADGRVAFVAPAFEAKIADGLPAGSELVTWEEHEDAYGCVVRAAGALGIVTGTILLDGQTWLETEVRLQAVLPRATLRPDPGVMETVRIVKTPEEVEAIRGACGDTGRVFPLVAEGLRAGESELELSRGVLNRMREAGLSVWGELIQGGESASVPHQATGPRRFRDGDAVVVDFVCRRNGYLGDMTRTFGIGRPEADVRRAYAVVRDAQRAAIETVRPGVTCEAVDRAARAVIERAGLGEYFVHRLGHGIGLDGHEPPYFVDGSRRRLAPGMCVTVEPGVYAPGRFGVRIEDVVAVTPGGCEILTKMIPTDVSEAFEG
jgi:Xaa-Pro aminopeptidase